MYKISLPHKHKPINIETQSHTNNEAAEKPEKDGRKNQLPSPNTTPENPSKQTYQTGQGLSSSQNQHISHILS
jgi:hypothetical protein